MKQHEGTEALAARTRQAAMVTAGGAVSLADSIAIIADDARFPTQPNHARDKLQGWSIVIDVVLGPNHAGARAVRTAIQDIGPHLENMAAQMGDTAGAGMELVCRVMFDIQQDFFIYLNALAQGEAPVAPTFSNVKGLVRSSRAACLAPLPAAWYTMVSCPRPRDSRQPAPLNTPPEMRVPSGAATMVNAHRDERLTQRYKDGNYSSITAMIGGREVEVPKHSGQPVCLAWALKGACNNNCRRAHQHVRYSQTTVKALHKLMTDCGVPGTPQ
jgi:hypothetical protein